MLSNDYQTLEISSCFSQAKQTEETIVQAAEHHGHNDESVFALRLSIEEALTNAIRHGNQCDTGKKVNIRYLITPRLIDIYVTDEGSGFDPGGVPDPTCEENLSRPNGRGILLMRAYMNTVEFNATGNQVHLVKHIDTLSDERNH